MVKKYLDDTNEFIESYIVQEELFQQFIKIES
jgi:hypothetical protein